MLGSQVVKCVLVYSTGLHGLFGRPYAVLVVGLKQVRKMTMSISVLVMGMKWT